MNGYGFGGYKPRPLVSLVKKPKPPTAAQERERSLVRVQDAARTHWDAVETAKQWKGQHVPQHLVDKVLSAGTSLEHSLKWALEKGVTVEELREVSRLHPSYLETIELEQGGASAVW